MKIFPRPPKVLPVLIVQCFQAFILPAADVEKPECVLIHELGLGWAKNSINAPIFRKNSVISDDHYQFVSYYNPDGYVVIAKRQLNSCKWEIAKTPFTGNTYDAHNSISLGLDGDGYLHISWDHHNNALNYARSLEPYSLHFPTQEAQAAMTGSNEQSVSYPEFYRFSNGDLLFAYRDGGSGNGNLILNRYHLGTQQWERIQSNLIDGENLRSAYWQLCVDQDDTVHLSWVWRETPDVASNHGMAYAKSRDGGITWETSSGKSYSLPIRMANAEVIHVVEQNSNLINQTSMTTDSSGSPYIVTYYRETRNETTQFHLIYLTAEGQWKHSTVTHRSLDFELSGIGSRSIPISRPQILVEANQSDRSPLIHIIYRDEEYQNQVCISSAKLPGLEWQTSVLHPQNMNRWEPSYDPYQWQQNHQLHLFLQSVGQGQAETLDSVAPQPVRLLQKSLNNRPQ